jgi:hypothetical protein
MSHHLNRAAFIVSALLLASIVALYIISQTGL